MAVVSSVSLLPLGFSAPTLSEPNPPHWPDSVAVFAPGDADIGAKISAAYASNGGHEPANHGQFSSKRFAFMFKPGTYDVDVPVGYYTQVLGLGALPSDVTFTSAKGVYSEEQDYSAGGALSTFWRAAENFKTTATYDWQVGKGMMWAVSQASPLRRIEVTNDLCLFGSPTTSRRSRRLARPRAASWPTCASAQRCGPAIGCAAATPTRPTFATSRLDRSSSGLRETRPSPGGMAACGTWCSRGSTARSRLTAAWTRPARRVRRR